MTRKTAAYEAIRCAQMSLQAIRALVGENVLLRQALIEIAGTDPGFTTYQAQAARRALEQIGEPKL